MLVSKKPCGLKANPYQPNVSWWNMVRLGKQGWVRVGHMHVAFMLLSEIFFLVEYGLITDPKGGGDQ